MFNYLGRGVSRRPKLFIVFWLLLVALGAAGSLWGFGQGNLFSRMSSSESMVPGSESDNVLLRTSGTNAGEAVVAVVTGATYEELGDDVDQLRSELEAIEHVENVADPTSVAELFDEEVAASTDEAVSQALADNQDAIDGAVEQALAENEEQIEGAAALAAQEAQTAATQATANLPAAQAQAVIEEQTTAAAEQAREQVRTEIETAARDAATKEIETAARDAAADETAKLENPAVDFASEDGFIIAVTLEEGEYPDSVDAVSDAVAAFEAEVQETHPDLTANVNSSSISEELILNQVAKDLVLGEAIGLPIALFLLVIVFGGVMAAGLPLGAAVTSIAIGLGIIWLVTFVTNVDSFILNIISLIGLALSIDYGLLVVSRYREEIAESLKARGLPTDGSELPGDANEMVTDAVATTVRTAGRTVSFSALTIAFAIGGLLVMDAPILKMIAVGGIVVTVLAVTTAVTLVPAIIELLGTRLVVPSKLSRMPGFSTLVEKVGDSASDEGFFSRLARWVHARPWPVLIGTVLILLVMAIPIRDFQMRSNFVEYIPSGSDASQAYDAMQEDYPAFSTPSGTVVAFTEAENTEDLVKHIEGLPGVSRVESAEDLDDETVTIDFYVDAEDQVGRDVTRVVEQIREYDAGYKTEVGGAAALQLDFNNAIAEDAPLAALIIIVSVFILLFLLTGSVVAPLKALAINTLSLIAGLGATVYIFEQGLFGMPQVSGLETFVVAAAIAFGFGLAMDYEVFLLARIKEYWDKGMTNDEAVEFGLQRSGRIITSAAAIIVAVFIGFVFGDLLPIKQIGIALAIIVTVDATIVRMLLVPAVMTLMGKWNWWAPKPLTKVYKRFKLVH